MSVGYAFNPSVRAVDAPPIGEAQRWAADSGQRILDTAQAVPAYPPAPGLRRHLAAALERNDTHLYTDLLGLPALRAELAAHTAAAYGGEVQAAQVAITAGCNQAFCMVMTALAGPGEEVVLPVPYYFNHQMWLRMQGIVPRYLNCDASSQLPDPDAAAALLTPRTRAIVLVSPNNPTGAVYPPALMRAFLELARRRGIALVVDETYKDFLPDAGPAHRLFQDPDWADTLVQLYSFSKAYCLTGHRVGSVIGAPSLLAELEKVADCVAICAPHPGQLAALYGLRELSAWRADKRRMMAERLATLRGLFAGHDLPFELLSAGAYFAWLRHPFADETAAEVARRLARHHGVLCLPGSIFGPHQERALRVAFANLEATAMPELAARLVASQGARAAGGA